jgi:hypothetical protein
LVACLLGRLSIIIGGGRNENKKEKETCAAKKVGFLGESSKNIEYK